MKTILRALGALALAFCIYPTDASEVEAKLPTELMDLPVELRLDIYEQLDFRSLIRTSEAFSRDRDLFETVFRMMLKDHEFEIIISRSDGEMLISYGESYRIKIGSDKSFERITEFLQNFGQCIRKLNIYSSSLNNNFWNLLAPSITNLAKFVNEITIDGEEFINNYVVTDPFPYAEIVKIRDGTFNATALHKLFPAVRSLDLDCFTLSGILPHAPHLERLKTPWRYSLDLLERTLELNSQIKHLIIDHYSGWNKIQRVSEILPELESLEFVYDRNEGASTAPIRFTNMKVFKFKTSLRFGPVDAVEIEFGNLEEIEFDGQDSVDYWVDLIMKNEKLRIVSSKIPLRREHLEKIAVGLPNLEDFTTECKLDDPESIRDIVDFLQSANQLKKASFLGIRDTQHNGVAQQLFNEWELTTNDAFSCSLVRK